MTTALLLTILALQLVLLAGLAVLYRRVHAIAGVVVALGHRAAGDRLLDRVKGPGMTELRQKLAAARTAGRLPHGEANA